MNQAWNDADGRLLAVGFFYENDSIPFRVQEHTFFNGPTREF